MNRSLSLPFLAAGLALLLSLPGAAQAQTAPLISRVEAYAMDTGRHENARGVDARSAFITIVEVANAPWLRLRFSEVALGKGSYLTVTSLLDGAWQRLDAAAVEQWKNTSAYFNGSALRLELHVAPGDEGVFARMEEVLVGEHGAPESQCGPTDDRTASSNPRAGRLLSVGCTAWLIPDGRFVTAGHCLESGFPANVVEFDVPPSLANGTLQHPGPEDQYTVVAGSEVSTDGGIGNDWGTFQTAPNTQTGLTALDAQGVAFELAQDLGPATIRITGYGVDDGTANQTQQTHTGPNAGSSGTTMRYRTDTEGGNSGSPVIDEATGRAVGVHTHGGCTTSGGDNNSGTSTFHAAFWQELNRTFPVAVFEPDLSEGLDVALAAGATGTAQLTIRNEGEGDLTYDFLRYSERGGGPDGFGYQWSDSNEPDGPTFNWFDVSAIGTPGPSSDDSSVDVALPWPFEFYGVPKTSLKMSSNGHLTFGTDGTDYSNDPIPNTEAPNDLIAGFWDDLNPSTSGGQTDHYYDDANDRYIFQWTNVARYSDSASRVTFQIILSRSGIIEYQYLTMTGDLTSASVGIEDANGSIGLEVVYDAAYVQNNLAVRFDLAALFVTAVSPATGTVPEGQSATVTVSLSADGLDAGTYLNYLAIQTNEPGSYSYPVALEVTDGAAVSLDAEATSPLTVPPGGSVSFDYTVTNNTGSALTGDLFFRARRNGNAVGAGIIRSGTLPGGQSVSGSYTQAVPANAPTGSYDYTINVGNFPGTSIASQSFTIVVTGAGRTAGEGAAWVVTDATPWTPVEAAALTAAGGADGVYPNPLAGQAHIAFVLDADADVRLAVYDVLGREVALLVEGAMKAGAHQAVFDARGLRPGTYLYRITAGAKVTTGRMTLLD